MSYGEKIALTSTRLHFCVQVWTFSGSVTQVIDSVREGGTGYTPRLAPPSPDNFGGAVLFFDLGRGPHYSP